MRLTDKELELIEFALLDSGGYQGGFTDAEFSEMNERMDKLMEKVQREMKRREKRREVTK